MMNQDFSNVYEDRERARAYADLEYPGTYYLAFRDIPELLHRHARGTRALDFGCGAGRSTRFLQKHGFVTTGVDIADAMLELANERDPHGEYLLVPAGDLSALGVRQFDVVLCAFTFDNIPDEAMRTELLRQLRVMLAPGGCIINLVSAPEIYRYEWASFSTRDFPENARAKSGQLVRIVMLDVPDRRPVEDVVWFAEDYQRLYAGAGLRVSEVHRPLGRDDDPVQWISERNVAPWTIYVLHAQSTLSSES